MFHPRGTSTFFYYRTGAPAHQLNKVDYFHILSRERESKEEVAVMHVALNMMVLVSGTPVPVVE